MNYIYHHLGLGDHIICNGLVRSLIDEDKKYFMFVKEHNLTSVKFMYRDLSNLDFIVGDDVYAQTFLKQNNINRDNLIVAGFYRHPQSIEFDDSFYLQNNLDFNLRWDKFKVNRELEREINLFKKYNIKEGEYIFLHDDTDRNYVINQNYIINKDLKIISPKKGLTDNVFDYCYLMENSFESHFIDSSFKLIFDSLKLRNNNIFYHIKLNNNVIKDSFTKSQSILNFKLIQ